MMNIFYLYILKLQFKQVTINKIFSHLVMCLHKFEHVVVADVNADPPSHQLRTVILYYIKDQAGGFI